MADTTKYMDVNAYVAPDSAISSDDVDKLAKITDENERYAAAVGILKRFGGTSEKGESADAVIAKIKSDYATKFTTITEEGPTSI